MTTALELIERLIRDAENDLKIAKEDLEEVVFEFHEELIHTGKIHKMEYNLGYLRRIRKELLDD